MRYRLCGKKEPTFAVAAFSNTFDLRRYLEGAANDPLWAAANYVLVASRESDAEWVKGMGPEVVVAPQTATNGA